MFLRALALLAIAFGLAAAAAEPPAVAVVVSEAGGQYAEATQALRGELERSPLRPTVLVLSPEQVAEVNRAGVVVVAAVGARAAQAVIAADPRAPVLVSLVPRIAFERMAARSGRDARRLSAVFLDQPPGRQLDLLRAALPERRRIGVLLGPESADLAPALERAAAERGMRLAVERASGPEDLFGALARVLGDADALLALPDARVFGSATIQNILVTTFRAQAPVMAFSPAYVRAGALLAVYSSPAQVGVQTGEILRASLDGRALPAPQYPRDFSVAVNAVVARSLGLKIEDEGVLRERLRALEARP